MIQHDNLSPAGTINLGKSMEFSLTGHVSNKFIFLWFSPNKHYTWLADPVVMYVAKIDCSTV